MKKYAILLVLFGSIIGLFVWSNNAQKKNITYFEGTEIICLTNGHQKLAEHIHPVLKITVDGVAEEIPSNVGIIENCMSEIHTHDASGTIHAESFLSGRVANFSLQDFFTVWKKEVMRDGYDLEIMQDGEIKSSIGDVKLIDHSKIELKYTSKL